MKTEAEMFAEADALVGDTMIVFSDRQIATRYALHRAEHHGQTGVIPMAIDTRTQSGLCVIWRDRVPPERFGERLRNCLWLLEETLAGRHPWPQAGATDVVVYNGQP